MKYGMDVSKYDGVIDWRRARDEGDLSLAIIKTSEGTAEDPLFRPQREAAKGILPRVFYQFMRCNVDIEDQALKFWSLVRDDFDPATDQLAVDFETKDGKSNAYCLVAADTMLALLSQRGTLPLLYTYPYFWKGLGGEKFTSIKRYPLWLAQWPLDFWIVNWFPITPLFSGQRLIDLKAKITDGRLKPMHLAPWTNTANPYPAIWQATARLDTRAVPGHPAIKKACDFNAIYMDLHNFPVTPPPVPPTPPSITYKATIGLWVLSGPGNQYKATDHINMGTTVSVLAEVNGYAQIVYGTKTGWVSASCLVKV